MAVIHTIEDLVRVLDENPEWVEALRARLLTRELLELPRIVAEFAEATNKRFDAMDKRLDAMDKRFDAMDKRLDAMDKRFDGIDKRLDRMDDSIGVLKGAHARNAALGNAALIAHDLGFSKTRILPQDELISLVQSRTVADIPRNERRSFLNADLIMEAVDQDGQVCYVAAEISFTVDERDTRRARRNAALLTRFTGKRADAVVAGMSKDQRIQGIIETGDVFWYQLEAEDVEVD